MNGGIYQILNTANGRIYIGSSKDIRVRWSSHKSDFKRGINSPHLQNAYNKYGKDAFEFSIIEYVKDKNSLLEREQFWIDSYDFDSLYNLNPVASSSLGVRRSKEQCKAMSEARKGQHVSPETEFKRGHIIAEAVRQKIGKAHKLNPSNSVFEKGCVPWIKGKKHSEESKRKMSKSHSKYLVYDGQSKTVKNWAEEKNIIYETLVARLRLGWSVEKALTTPVRSKA